MRLRLASRARRDVSRIHLEGIDRFGLTSADAYLDGLMEAFDGIVEHPFIGRRHGPGGVCILRYRAHVIVYEPSREVVSILRVRHGREDWYAQLGG